MADHGFGGTDRQRGRAVAKNFAHGPAFGLVVGLGAGAVHIEVANLFRGQTGVGEGAAHGLGQTAPARFRRRTMMRVVAQARTQHRRARRCAAPPRGFGGFQKHEGRRLAEVQPGRFGKWRALALAGRLQAVETRERAGGKGIRAAGERRVQHPAADEIRRQGDGRRAGGARRDHGGAEAADAQRQRQRRRAGIVAPGKKFRRRELGPAADDALVMIFDEQHRAGTGGKNQAQPPPEINRLTGGGQRLARGGQRQMNVAVVRRQFSAGLKVGNLPGELRAQPGGARIGNGGEAAGARHEPASRHREVGPGAGQNSQPGDDHAAAHVCQPRRNTAAKL